MGRFDWLRSQGHEAPVSPTPPEDARDHDSEDNDLVDAGAPLDSAIARPVQLLFAIGIDGHGPLKSAMELADAARAGSRTNEEAVATVARMAILRGSAGGLVTGLGGFSAMRVALPVNVVEFYVQAARMVAAIAILRGHEISDAQVRKAVLQTLVATQANSVLVKAVSATRGGALARRLLGLLPAGARLVANKGIGFRLLHGLSDRLFGRRGRHAPFIGGLAVAITDGGMMRRVAEQAMADFPAQGRPATEPTDQDR